MWQIVVPYDGQHSDYQADVPAGVFVQWVHESTFVYLANTVGL